MDKKGKKVEQKGAQNKYTRKYPELDYQQLEKLVDDYRQLKDRFKPVEIENHNLRSQIISLQGRLIEYQGNPPAPTPAGAFTSPRVGPATSQIQSRLHDTALSLPTPTARTSQVPPDQAVSTRQLRNGSSTATTATPVPLPSAVRRAAAEGVSIGGQRFSAAPRGTPLFSGPNKVFFIRGVGERTEYTTGVPGQLDGEVRFRVHEVFEPL
jgi:hypothetical protein